MTSSTPRSVSLASPLAPPSQLVAPSPRRPLYMVSHKLLSSCQCDKLQYLADSSKVLGTSAFHLPSIVTETFPSLPVSCTS